MESSTFHWRVDAPWEKAEESLLRIAPNARIRSDADLRHRMQVDGDERFTLLRFRLAGELEALSDPDDTVTITCVRAGWMHWAIGEERGDSALPWMQSAGGRTRSRFGALDEIAVFLPRARLLAFARALYGDDDLRLDFDGPLPVDAAHGHHFAAVLEHAHAVSSSDAFEQPVLRAALYRNLAVSLLGGYRLRGDRVARAVSAEEGLRRYRLAVRFLDDNAFLPITVEDAAHVAHTSTAELDRTFRAHSARGDGVRAHLRRARLSAAHDDLVQGDPTLGDTVREIAQRWGYLDPSTFAKHYRRSYGVNPRWVLDR